MNYPTEKYELQIIEQGELNNLEDYEIDKAIEFFDKAVRRGLEPHRSMLDIIDMMCDMTI